MNSFTIRVIPFMVMTVLASCMGTENREGPMKGSLDSRVADALERAGENAKEIKSFLSAYEPGSEKGTAARFLVSFMPTVDLASMSGKDLQENLELAFEAWKAYPWTRKVSFPLFLHYVLPHRVTQEPYHPWRKFFREKLSPFLGRIKSMEEAIIAINNWCAKWVKFRQTEFRDQSAVDTYKSGYGRCEEMMIVSILALRSAGIPARPCSAPWWVVTDNNHAWVEAWADGRWYFLGGCEKLKKLNSTWFASPAKRAGMVVSTMYGTPEFFPTGDRVYKVSMGTSYINSTSVYTATGRLRLVVKGKDGKPAAGCPYAVSVFNFGALRPLTVRKTGPEGAGTVELGTGTFFLSAGIGKQRAYKVIRIYPGQELNVEMALRESAVPPRSFWLRYPTPEEARAMFAGSGKPSEVNGREPHEIQVLDIPRPPVPGTYGRGKDPALDRMLEGFKQRERLEKLLKERGVKPVIVAEVSSSVAAAELVQAGLGVSVLNPFPLALQGQGGLVYRPFPAAPSYQTYFVTPDDRPLNRIARHFMQHVRLHTPEGGFSQAV